jgi:3-oxoacyl-[acyl-carrier protein] reductase
MSYPSLHERVVVVTGAAGGIGRATVGRFLAEGARVVAWDVDAAALESIAPRSEQLVTAPVDVTDAADVEAGVESALERWSCIDVLVNNAGIVRDAQLVKWRDGVVVDRMTDEAFDAVLAVNLKGAFVCARAVTPHMIAKQSGVVLNATSVVAANGNFGQTNYVAAKAGVEGLTRTWARELGRHGIRVNAVAPGFIDTGMTRGIPANVVEAMVGRTPLGRIGRVEDVASAYAWLASDEAAFVHGAVIAVDGGLVIGT